MDPFLALTDIFSFLVPIFCNVSYANKCQTFGRTYAQIQQRTVPTIFAIIVKEKHKKKNRN